MFKGILMGVGAVAMALTLALTPSLRASASTPDFETIEFTADINHCIDDPGNSNSPGVGLQNWDNCLSTIQGSGYLQGEQFAAITSTYGGFELQAMNTSNGPLCLDNRGKNINGTQYVLKTCNDSSAQAFIIWCDSTDNSQLLQPNNDVVWLSGNNTSDGTTIVVYNDTNFGADGRTESHWTVNSSAVANANEDGFGLLDCNNSNW